MRMDSSGTGNKERKQVQNASNKISCVVHRVLLPLLSANITPSVSFKQVGYTFDSCLTRLNAGRLLVHFV